MTAGVGIYLTAQIWFQSTVINSNFSIIKISLGHYASGALTYTGGWSWGKRHGTGIMRYSSSSYYDGSFNNGLEHGFGIRQWESMDLYKGEYKNGKRHGKGLMIWRSAQEG